MMIVRSTIHRNIGGYQMDRLKTSNSSATGTPWKVSLAAELREGMHDAAFALAERLRDPLIVQNLANQALSQGAFVRYWSAMSVSSGPASIAIFMNQMDLCDPGMGWDKAAHRHLSVALAEISSFDGTFWVPDGLYNGLSGIALASQLLGRGGTRYVRLQSQLDKELFETLSYAPVNRVPNPEHNSWQNYDIITGSSGICRYLLDRYHDPSLQPLLNDMLDALILRSRAIETIQGYLVGPDDLPSDYHREKFPAGYVDLGLAHGVPGPLSILAISLQLGLRRPGIEQAIDRMADWLWSNRLDDFTWSMGKGRERVTHSHASHAAWCYGAVGVASSLLLAGEALHRPDLTQKAIATLEGIAQKSAGGMRSPIICHGTAGVLQVTLRFLNRITNPTLAEFAARLATDLMQSYRPDRPVCFSDTEDSALVDSPAFLDGAAGIGLVLLAGSTQITPSWDQLLLLS